MLVKAKYQIAYRNQLIPAGEEFDLAKSDYIYYQHDVEVINAEVSEKAAQVEPAQSEAKALKGLRNKMLKKGETKGE